MNQQQQEAIEFVIGTLNGNSYGLTAEDRLEALVAVCQMVQDAFPGIKEKVFSEMGLTNNDN